jgi:aerobic carbon-monoxide dehydrogenase medium subunit
MQVPAPFEYERATSVEEALELLTQLGPDAQLLAGGHSLLPMMKLRLASPAYLIDIDPLADELGYVTEHGGEVRMSGSTCAGRCVEAFGPAATRYDWPADADASSPGGS